MKAQCLVPNPSHTAPKLCEAPNILSTGSSPRLVVREGTGGEFRVYRASIRLPYGI